MSEIRKFESGSVRDGDKNKPLVGDDPAYSRLRYGAHMRNGANKYKKGNWQLGQPTEAILESLHRHLAFYEMGDRTEDHLMAIKFAVNMLAQNEQREGISWDAFLIKQ
jgi:hypothetical protein